VTLDAQHTTDADIGARIRTERLERGWSLTDLAERSGVSRAMINKVERGESSPTASLLGRLSGAFGLTLSTLLARAEGASGGRLVRAADQPRWQDPATGYVRRQIAPLHGSDIRLELVHVALPAGAVVAFPASSYAFMRQVILVLGGRLTFTEGDVAHELESGDCLELGLPADCTFRNETAAVCTYLVAVVRR
jgi:transcriptional regulator with XRE-family HTH domain